MATEFRVDDWINEAGGVVEVRYTYGTTPPNLPSQWSGFSLRFGTKSDVDTLIVNMESTYMVPEMMLGVLCARFKRQSPDYSNPAQILAPSRRR